MRSQHAGSLKPAHFATYMIRATTEHIGDTVASSAWGLDSCVADLLPHTHLRACDDANEPPTRHIAIFHSLRRCCCLPIHCLAGVGFVIAIILIASIWSWLKTVSAHSRAAADILAGECRIFLRQMTGAT